MESEQGRCTVQTSRVLLPHALSLTSTPPLHYRARAWLSVRPAGQTLAKIAPGPGRVSGTQGIGAAQGQYARNGFMQMGEGALVVGTQGASITGGVGMVTTTMYANVSQDQFVTNW